MCPPDDDADLDADALPAALRARLAGLDSATLDSEFAAAYQEIRRLARRTLRFERNLLTLDTTGLVNEAYLQFASKRQLQWQDRQHFLNLAALIMRRLVIDHSRARLALKRGGHQEATRIDDINLLVGNDDAEELLRLDALLDELARRSERAARVVQCRFYGGLTVEETAEALGIAPATVKRDWAMARAWLKRAMPDGHR